MNDTDPPVRCGHPHGNIFSICEEFYGAGEGCVCWVFFTAISAFICLFLPLVGHKNINNDFHICWGGTRKNMWVQIHISDETMGMGILRACIQTKQRSWCKIITQLSHRGIKLNVHMTRMINCFSFSTSARHTGETGLFFSEIQNINHGH